jgi:transcriptional regulator with XRE-family HTH domain
MKKLHTHSASQKIEFCRQKSGHSQHLFDCLVLIVIFIALPIDPAPKEFLRRVKERREALGMTQEMMAKELGLKAAPSYGNIERGHKLPNSKHLYPIARALGTSLAELFSTDQTIQAESVRIAALLRPDGPVVQRIARKLVEELAIHLKP